MLRDPSTNAIRRIAILIALIAVMTVESSAQTPRGVPASTSAPSPEEERLRFVCRLLLKEENKSLSIASGTIELTSERPITYYELIVREPGRLLVPRSLFADPENTKTSCSLQFHLSQPLPVRQQVGAASSGSLQAALRTALGRLRIRILVGKEFLEIQPAFAISTTGRSSDIVVRQYVIKSRLAGVDTPTVLRGRASELKRIVAALPSSLETLRKKSWSSWASKTCPVCKGTGKEETRRDVVGEVYVMGSGIETRYRVHYKPCSFSACSEGRQIHEEHIKNLAADGLSALGAIATLEQAYSSPRSKTTRPH